MTWIHHVLGLLVCALTFAACEKPQPAPARAEGIYFDVAVDGIQFEVVGEPSASAPTPGQAPKSSPAKQTLFTLSSDEQAQIERGTYAWPPVHRTRPMISSALGSMSPDARASIRVYVRVDDNAHPALFDRFLNILRTNGYGWRRAELLPTSRAAARGEAAIPLTLPPLTVSSGPTELPEYECVCLERTIVVSEGGYDLRIVQSGRPLEQDQASTCKKMKLSYPYTQVSYEEIKGGARYVALGDGGCPSVRAGHDLTSISEALEELADFAPWCPAQHVRVYASSPGGSFRHLRGALETAYASSSRPVQVHIGSVDAPLDDEEERCDHPRISLDDVKQLWPEEPLRSSPVFFYDSTEPFDWVKGPEFGKTTR